MSNQPEQPQQSIGKIIDRMVALRDERRVLSAQDKALKEEFTALESTLIDALNAQDSIQGKSRSGTATITEDVVANVKDWDAVFDYITENQAMYLVQRRLNNAAWRELLAVNGEPLPGTEPFTKRSISLKTN